MGAKEKGGEKTTRKRGKLTWGESHQQQVVIQTQVFIEIYPRVPNLQKLGVGI